MKEEKTLEFLKEQLERTNYWLSFAEAKNGAIVALNIAMMTIIVNFFSYAPVLCTIVLSCLTVSIVICLISFFPNLKLYSKKEDANKINLLFYSDIAKLCEDQYISKCKCTYGVDSDKKGFDQQIARDFMSEIHINSCIANKKYVLFKWALKIDMLTLIICIIIFIAA